MKPNYLSFPVAFILAIVCFCCFNINAQDGNNSGRHCGTQPMPVEYENWLNQCRLQMIANGTAKMNTAYTIPVIVHVVHNGNAIGVGDNISDAQIYSQFDVLNEDFKKLNSNWNQTPAVWTNLVADCEITFCPAKNDPNGNPLPTPGIERINRNNMGWPSPPYDQTDCNTIIKPQSIWNPQNYLNIWSIDLGNGLLGYATFPPGTPLNGIPGNPGTMTDDGVVILYNAFGRTGNLINNYDLGRTVTHEIGHWLGLRHIWGDGNCADDYCNDTPPATAANSGCPVFPHNVNSCGTNSDGEMFVNYMDYCYDYCLTMFSIDQKSRMQIAMANSPLRTGFANSPAGCAGGGGLGGCDTITNFVIGVNTPQIYPTPNGTGYISGHNSFLDVSKADKFLAAQYQPGSFVTGAVLYFGAASATNNTNTFDVKVWDDNGLAGSPGSPMGSEPITYLTASTHVLQNALSLINFATPIAMSGDFYLGINFDYNVVGDEVALYTSADGQTTPATAWEQWDNLDWYRYDDSQGWAMNVCHIVLPVMCSPAGEEEVKTNGTLFLQPNPAQYKIKIMYDGLNSKSEIKIFDVEGRLQQCPTESVMNGIEEFDISKLCPGIYFIRVADGEKILSKKFVKY